MSLKQFSSLAIVLINCVVCGAAAAVTGGFITGVVAGGIPGAIDSAATAVEHHSTRYYGKE